MLGDGWGYPLQYRTNSLVSRVWPDPGPGAQTTHPPHIRSTHTPRASHLRSAGLAWQPDIGGNLTFVACSPDPGKLFGLLETLLRGSPAESLFPRQQTRSARMRFVEVRTATRECDARM